MDVGFEKKQHKVVKSEENMNQNNNVEPMASDYLFDTENWQPWLKEMYFEVIEPRKKTIEQHPFMVEMKKGTASKEKAERYFSGLMWHLMDFGKHVEFLMQKRDPKVTEFLKDRSEDKDGDTEILGRIVQAFGGPLRLIAERQWEYNPHPVWIKHDALLRSAIYSKDLPWQVGTAALNIGIETLVPTMIEPLFHACVEKYGVKRSDVAWLESRSGEEEKQHGENGYLVLNHFVDPKDLKMISQCKFFIQALSDSMAHGLLQSGL